MERIMSFTIPIYARTYYPRSISWLERFITRKKGIKWFDLTVTRIDLQKCEFRISNINTVFQTYHQLTSGLDIANVARKVEITLDEASQAFSFSGKIESVLRIFSRTAPTCDIHRSSLEGLDDCIEKLEEIDETPTVASEQANRDSKLTDRKRLGFSEFDKI